MIIEDKESAKLSMRSHLIENLLPSEIAQMTKEIFVELLSEREYFDAFRRLHNLSCYADDILEDVIREKWDRFINEIKETV